MAGPSHVTAANLYGFFGGIHIIKAFGDSYRPGSDEWKRRILGEIANHGPRLIAAWLEAEFTAKLQLFQMMHGPRPVKAADRSDAWDNNLAEYLYPFFEANLASAFPDTSTRREQVEDWLAANIPDIERFLIDPPSRVKTAQALASTIMKALLPATRQPGQILASFGITLAAEDLKNWPEAGKPRTVAEANEALAARITAEPAEPVKPTESAKPNRGRRKRHIGMDATHFNVEFLERLQKSARVTSKELASITGIPYSQIYNGLKNEGLMMTRENLEQLINGLDKFHDSLVKINGELKLILLIPKPHING